MSIENRQFELFSPDTGAGSESCGKEEETSPPPAAESSRAAARAYLLQFLQGELPPKIEAIEDQFDSEVDRLEELYPGVFREVLEESDKQIEERTNRLFAEGGWTHLEPPDYAAINRSSPRTVCTPP